MWWWWWDWSWYKAVQSTKIIQKENLKLNKDNCHLRCIFIPFFGEIISRQGVNQNPFKFYALTGKPPAKTKKELQSFLSIMNYLSKFSLATADLSKLLYNLTSVRTEWTRNRSFQDLCKKATSLIKKDSFIKFYDAMKPLYLETDTSGVSWGQES